MSLALDELYGKFKSGGARAALLAIVSTIVLGVADYFTSKIVPTLASSIQVLFDPPTFYINFAPPVDAFGKLSLSQLSATGTNDVGLKETAQGSRVFVAQQSPGTYLVRLQGVRDKAGLELVATKKIENSGDTWTVDTSERNWASALAITSGVAPANATAPSEGSANSTQSRLSNTRWTVTERDFGILSSIDSRILKSLLANALAEVGVNERGTEWEAQRIRTYWTATGPEMASQARASRLPWGGAFVAWLVSQAGSNPPSGPASFLSWQAWSKQAPSESAKPGMLAVFKLNNSEVPQAPSRLLVGPIVRYQPGCIEVVLGNLSNRVVISCVAKELLLSIRDPD